MQNIGKKVALVSMLAIVTASSLLATPTALESSVTEIETAATSVTAQAATVLGASLGLFAIGFGVKWLIKLFRGTAA